VQGGRGVPFSDRQLFDVGVQGRLPLCDSRVVEGNLCQGCQGVRVLTYVTFCDSPVVQRKLRQGCEDFNMCQKCGGFYTLKLCRGRGIVGRGHKLGQVCATPLADQREWVLLGETTRCFVQSHTLRTQLHSLRSQNPLRNRDTPRSPPPARVITGGH
jgi:hypothetical protein